MTSATWSGRLASLSILAIVLGVTGCAPIPPPRVVAEVDAIAVSKAALEAKSLAPSAFARAEKLRRDAHEALKTDRQARAQIIAEEAITAYEEASALARTARAERSEQEASAESEKSARELSGIEGEELRARAEVDALETRLKVTRDAQPITPSGSAAPAREEARKQAAYAMAVQAKLLCTASRLLSPTLGTAPAEAPTPSPAALPSPDKASPDKASPDKASPDKASPDKASPDKASPDKASPDKTPKANAPAVPDDPGSPASIARDLTQAEADLGKLDTELAAASPAPIDLATRARASCLSVLTRVRRSNASATKAPGAGDALLQELSGYASRDPSGLSPGRDERGVSVTLRGVFDGESLSSAATARLAELDRVGAAHPDFAVAIVLHSDKALAKGDEERWKARADKIAAAFKSVPKQHLSTLVAGNFSPLVDPHGKDKAKNLRVEVIFVSPESL